MSNILEKNKVIKDKVVEQILGSNEFPYFYSVVQFGFYDDNGYKLPISEISKFWDRTEVEKTNRLLKNLLKEAFGIDGFWFFMERHSPLLDENGDVAREGRYHINIITSQMKDSAVEEPNRKCRRLLLEDSSISGVPIKDRVYDDIDDLKIELFNACCRKANWVNRYKYAIKTQILYDPVDVEQTTNYCLKDFSPKKGKDFMDIIDFKNSDFYRPES